MLSVVKPSPLPVITFHSVRPSNLPWQWDYLSCPPDLFEFYLRYLKSRHYSTVQLLDVLEYNLGKKDLPARSTALTFDDGYLDNWTIVVPLLKKYGFQGTIFINPSFVDPRDIIRPQVEPGTEPVREQVDGFMSWNELKLAQAEGILDVQSHGMTHTWYPASERVIDFHNPGDNYPWLSWNARPDRKPFWISEGQSEFVDYGTPVYEHEKSLIIRRYFPKDDLTERLTSFVKDNGGTAFFEQSDWRELLFTEAGKVKDSGHFETEQEYRDRVFWELKTSRDEISSRLGKPVYFMCWPGGGYNDSTIAAAKAAGYTGWDERSGPGRHGMPNIPDKPVEGISRISIPVLSIGILSRLVNQLIFIYKVESYRESSGWRELRWILRKLNVAPRLLKRMAGLH